MSSNIDRSLDEIIKDQRKARRKELKATAQKGKQKQGRAGAGPQKKQNMAKKQAGKRQLAGQRNQATRQKQGKGPRQQAMKTNPLKNKQGPANRAQGRAAGRVRVNANRLSQKKTKQIVSVAKKIQANKRSQRQQNRQTQQRDARQNIIDARRGVQNVGRGPRQGRGRGKGAVNNNRGTGQFTVSAGRGGVRINRNRQRQTQQQVLNQSQQGRRRWGGGRASTSTLAPRDMRVSVPNDLHEPSPLELSQTGGDFELEGRFNYNLGKTSRTLNARFSSPRRGGRKQSSNRTIVLE